MPPIAASAAPAAESVVPLPARSAARVGLGRRLATNYVFQLISQGIRIGEQILLIPLFLVTWGVDLYRDWLVLASILAFVASCNLGVELYFGNVLLKHAARDEVAKMNRLLGIGLLCALAIGTALAVLALGAAWSVDLAAALNTASMDAGTARIVLTLIIFPVCVLIPEQVLLTVYRASGEFNRGEMVFILYNLIQLCSVAASLVMGASPPIVAMCYLIAPLLYVILLMTDLRTRYKQLRFNLLIPRVAELRQIVPPSLLYFTIPLAYAVSQHGTMLLLGVLQVGATAVVAFTVYRTFSGLARQAANQFAVGGGIEMARQIARGDVAGCSRLYAGTGRIVTGLVGLFAGISIPAAAPLIAIWTRGTVGAEPLLLLALLAGIFAAGPGQAALALLKYSNEARPCAVAWSIQAGAGLAGAVVLVPAFGAPGAALAFGVSEFLGLTLYLTLVVEKRFGFSARTHWLRSYGVGAVAFAISYAAAMLVLPRQSSVGLVDLGVSVLGWAALISAPAALLLLSPVRRARLLAAVGRRVRPSPATMRSG